MGSILVGIVTLLYAITSYSYFQDGNHGLGIVFAGYAFANIGLLMVGGNL